MPEGPRPFVSLSGKATPAPRPGEGRGALEEPFKAWFPRARTTRIWRSSSVTPQEGEYWDNEGLKKIKYLFEAAKAYATGTKPHIDEGEQHAKVKLYARRATPRRQARNGVAMRVARP